MELEKGQNVPLSGRSITVAVSGSLDLTALVLSEDGKVSGDADMVYYNSPLAAGVQLDGRTVHIDLGALRPGASRVVIVASAADQASTFGQLPPFSLTVQQPGGGLAFTPRGLASETVLVLCELYLRGTAWKLRAIGAGYDTGLAGVATDFGVDIDEPSPTIVLPSRPPVPEEFRSTAPGRPTPQSSVPAAAAPLGHRVTLTKAAPTVSFTKGSVGSTGHMRVNLNWTSPKAGLFGRSRAVDLDLGCLWQAKNGSKGVIQALGRQFGDMHKLPYVALDRDDRTGANLAGETLTINMDRFGELKRVLIFAYIYDGTPNWDAANASVTMHPVGGGQVFIPLVEGSPKARSCAIALVTNVKGDIHVRREIRFINGTQDAVSRAYRWGMKWSEGTK